MIYVEVVPHKSQRYPTVGDWQFLPGGLHVSVSDTGNRMSNMLVAIHEIVEAIMCEANGIKEAEVDLFDMIYEQHRTKESLTEPGDDINAPYYKEHKVADLVERLVAVQSGVDWLEHEKRVDALG